MGEVCWKVLVDREGLLSVVVVSDFVKFLG